MLNAELGIWVEHIGPHGQECGKSGHCGQRIGTWYYNWLGAFFARQSASILHIFPE